jgi:predicted DCC family thiol-disulfide oxidoreductase YuxK
MKLSFFKAPTRWAPRPVAGWPDHTILFDGVCILCSSWAQFVIRHDTAGRFRFVRIQSPQGRQLAQTLGIDPEAPETNAVIIDGIASFKSDAALAVACELPAMRWLGAMAVVPRGLRDWFYDRVARNRYAWFGRDEACSRLTPDLACRLLDHADQASAP